MTVRNKTFTHTSVKLDQLFDGCRFDHCRLVYDGTVPLRLHSCSLVNSPLEFDGPAMQTLSCLRGLYHAGGGFRREAERFIAAIKKPPDDHGLPPELRKH
jgi:hypothetical protein